MAVKTLQERILLNFSLDVQWPYGNTLDEIKFLKKAIGITADEDDEEGVSENKLANQRRIIESCNVLERSVMMEGRVLIQLELMWMGLKAQWM